MRTDQPGCKMLVRREHSEHGCARHLSSCSLGACLLDLVLSQMLTGIQKDVAQCRPHVCAHVLEMFTKQCLSTSAWRCRM